MNAEQQLAACTPGDVAIRAGAGTGKTRVVVERYVNQLRTGLSPLEILVVTYTEKAAAELRARIRARVAEEMGDQPDVLAELEAAQISTMHALCARICRDHPTAAQVPAGFTLLDDYSGRLHQARWIDQAVNRLPQGTCDVIGYSRLRRMIRELLTDPYAAAQALGRSSQDWTHLIENERAAMWTELLSSPHWQDAARQVRAQQGKPGDKLEPIRRAAEQALDTLTADAPFPAVAALLEIKINVGSKVNWTDLEAIKTALRTLRDTIQADPLLTLQHNAADGELRGMLPRLADAFTAVYADVAHKKHQAGVLDYTDLELHALEALTYPEVARAYQARWQSIMVDEFQDTSPLQATLLERLAAQATLTIVGDDQQAIYGFRGAGQNVFDHFVTLIQGRGGLTVTLNTSYRTQAALLDTVNVAAAAVLGPQARALSPAREGRGPQLTALQIQPDESSEVEQVTQRVAALLEAPLDIVDPNTGQIRALQAGDIAVLARTWSVLRTYEAAFDRLGIPAAMGGGGDLLHTPEVRDASVLLRFLADEQDEIALLSLLRSPYFSIDDATLDELQSVRGTEEAWWHLCRRSGVPVIQRAAATLQALRLRSADTPPRQLLQLADRLTGYRAVLQHLPDAQRHLADHQASHELIEVLQGPLQDCVSTSFALQSMLAADQRVARPPIQAEDAVTLSTIHGAKGLEWPVVALVGIDGRARQRFRDVRFDADLGVATRLSDEDGLAYEPALYTLLRHRVQRREQAEERRLIYVGLTRVRDYLLLSSSHAKSEVVTRMTESIPFES